MSNSNKNGSVLDKEVSDPKISLNKRYLIKYRDIDLLFTLKQIEVINLIAKGFSNSKIANQIKTKESNIKLMVYRLMKYLEDALGENIDRFYLIVLSQELLIIVSESYFNSDLENIKVD